jgi:hypothetical protein
MARVATSARRRLDGPWTSDTWREYRPGTPLRWFFTLLMLASFAGGILLAAWIDGAL